MHFGREPHRLSVARDRTRPIRVTDIRKTPEREEFCAAFAQLTFERQLEQFLSDVDHPPHYYPSWFASRILERLRQRCLSLHAPAAGYVWPWDIGR